MVIKCQIPSLRRKSLYWINYRMLVRYARINSKKLFLKNKYLINIFIGFSHFHTYSRKKEKENTIHQSIKLNKILLNRGIKLSKDAQKTRRELCTDSDFLISFVFFPSSILSLFVSSKLEYPSHRWRSCLWSQKPIVYSLSNSAKPLSLDPIS